MTLSFGITALNELQELYNKKSLVEDGKFAVDVMKYINKRLLNLNMRTDYYMRFMVLQPRAFAGFR